MHVLLTRKLDVLAIMKKLCITFVFMLAVSWRLSECKLKAGRSLRRAVSQPPKQCSFHNVNFTVGETWNPFLEPKGYYRCIKCSCKLTPDGLIAMVECKSQCKRVRCRDAYIPPGECCRRCPGSNVSENSSEKEKKDCLYNGALHKHGEVWPKGPEKPNLLSENQCTECSCMDGFVTCATRTCPSLSCDQKEPGNGTCCRVCAGVPERGRQPSDCKTMNRRYSHMESWHPRLPPSNDLCTNCTCKNSTIHCSSQECPTVACTNPVRKPGHCCLSCPADSSEKKPLLSSAENILIRVRTAVSKSSKVAGIIRKRRRKNKGECVWDKKTFPHNSWFSPTIVTFGVAVCVKCVCNASKIECERLRHKCPTNYTCKNPVSVPGECCKVCAGNSSQTPGNPLGTVGPALQPCSSGKNWRVFENRRRQGSEENVNDRIWVQFALEDKEQDYVEIHFIEANMTHKTVQISATTKNDFHTFMGRAHQQNKFYQYEYIGQIREGRRIKIRDREQRPCPKTRSCVQSVRNFIDILRKRGRQCRAIASLPPKTLLMLRNKG